MKMNNNDILKNYLRNMRKAGTLDESISGTDIACANRQQLEQWISDNTKYTVQQILDLHIDEEDKDDELQYEGHGTPIQKEEQQEAPAPAPLANMQGDDDDAMAILEILKRRNNAPAIDRDALKAEIIDELERTIGLQPLKIIIENRTLNLPPRESICHKAFPSLLRALQAKQNIYLVGGAGTGKTTGAEHAAAALGLPFYFNGAIDTEYKLLGFTDAMGRVVSRPFREAFINGGVYLFDEVDASFPSALLAFNAALANGTCDFPDGCHKRHEDFYCIAAANTFGHGATSQFSGRSKLDGAFLDRFVTIEWCIDEALEQHLALANIENQLAGRKWISFVRDCRERAAKAGLMVTISPRASIAGCKLLQAGFLWEEVAEMAVRKGLPATQWEKISQ